MKQFTKNSFTLALFAAATAAAHAGTVTLDWAPGSDISSLDLADGTWDQGSDWGHSAYDGTSIDAWSTQTWTGMDQVDFTFSLLGADSIPELAISQTLINNTGQAWTSFRMDLATDQSEPFAISLADTSSDAFADVQIQDLGDGDYAIIWSGGIIESGEQAQVFTSFGVFGTSPVAFAASFGLFGTPTPGSLSLLGFGGLLASRRRREHK